MIRIVRLALVVALAGFFCDASYGGDDSVAKPIAPDCSAWALDGYHLGMLGTELLAVRSVTLHVEGQAQVIEPGKLHGVLVLDALNRLEKWDVFYDTPNGDELRAELRERFGEPVSDVSGLPAGETSGPRRVHRMIWLSRECDDAIILHERTEGPTTAGRTISATLTRASSLKPGFVEWKGLYR